MADQCSCGCGTMTAVTEASEPCGCGCSCCGDQLSKDDEVAQLITLRQSIDQRLAELTAVGS